MICSSSASRASLASGMTDMLMMSPPHWRYINDSARVENAGPTKRQFRLISGSQIPHTLHADNGLSGVHFNPTPCLRQYHLHPRPNKLIQLITKRIPKHRMHHESIAPEERILPNSLRPVNDLVWNDEIARSDLFAE
jgi:hypothetical protein